MTENCLVLRFKNYTQVKNIEQFPFFISVFSTLGELKRMNFSIILLPIHSRRTTTRPTILYFVIPSVFNINLTSYCRISPIYLQYSIQDKFRFCTTILRLINHYVTNFDGRYNVGGAVANAFLYESRECRPFQIFSIRMLRYEIERELISLLTDGCKVHNDGSLWILDKIKKQTYWVLCVVFTQLMIIW